MLRYPCLVLDHDDTVMDSTAHIHYPAFLDEMQQMRPGVWMSLQDYFRKALSQQDLTVKAQALSDETLPVVLVEDEQVRRYKEMSAAYGEKFSFPSRYTLVVNKRSPIIRSLQAMEAGEKKTLLEKQLYDIARLSSRPLEAEDLKAFIAKMLWYWGF